MPSSGSPPETQNQRMDYYNGSLYLFTGTFIYKYDLETGFWIANELSGIKLNSISDNAICMNDGYLYSIAGWDRELKVPIYSIYKTNLSSETYEIQEISIEKVNIAEWSSGYVCKDNLMYVFGGGSLTGYYNNLSVLDLNQSLPKLTELSKQIKIPTARLGHGMEVYNDDLYIFGGLDKDGNR